MRTTRRKVYELHRHEFFIKGAEGDVIQQEGELTSGPVLRQQSFSDGGTLCSVLIHCPPRLNKRAVSVC